MAALLAVVEREWMSIEADWMKRSQRKRKERNLERQRERWRKIREDPVKYDENLERHRRYVHNWRAKVKFFPLQSLALASTGYGVVDIAFSTYPPSSMTTCPPKQPRNSSDSCSTILRCRTALSSS